jgi:hypothetical protein
VGLRRGGSGLIVAVVILAVGVVVGVLLAGPIFIEQPRWTGQLAPPPPPTRTPLPAETPGRPDQSMHWVQLVQNALYALLAVAVLLLLLRALMRMRLRWGARRSDRVTVMADVVVGSSDGGIIEAPVVRRGIARALAALDEQRDPSDAVVQAWLGFEDAAVAAGAARRPSETPTEYAVRIISRFDADRAAAEQLVHVYEDVRFGGRRADAAAVATARRCLLALQASWNDAAGATAGSARGSGPVRGFGSEPR